MLVVTSCSVKGSCLLIVSDRFRVYYRIIYSLVVPIRHSSQSRTTQRIPEYDDRVRDKIMIHGGRRAGEGPGPSSGRPAR
jgi:hypothetical protein